MWTSIIGGEEVPLPDPKQIGDTSKLQKGNNLVVKTCWPEDGRGIHILWDARGYGKTIKLIGNHIPEVTSHQDLNFPCSTTKTMREFLSLPTNGSHHLRIIAFRRLRPMTELNEQDILAAYFQCLFCKYHG